MVYFYRINIILPKGGADLAYRNIFDFHIHSDNSPDGANNAAFMCESAVARGVRSVAFTDHCEIDRFTEGHFNKIIMHSFFEVAKARSAFMNSLIVLEGIELGEPQKNTTLADKIIGTQNYDIVLGAVHGIEKGCNFSSMKGVAGEQAAKALTKYFDDLLLMTEWGNFDAVSHITYPFRYLDASPSDYTARFTEVLEALAKKDKALELDTRCGKHSEEMRKLQYNLALEFRKLGGKNITVGSGAHRAADIALGVNEALEIAVTAGFNCVALYQERLPSLVPIG